ncbi:uncharacterized protein LOC133830533 [Humulus lupulus]|uniref:uncharacterized protein LOC133830533 n=1 Tax=Humulus lupulus TaxID=3486 RepID=UPI002B41416B|nr:uncharacterized protein LOC133830533 [Humulus lupulus]
MRLPILRGLSFESKFLPTDPPDDDAASPSVMHQDLIAIQSKLAEVQDSQKCILLVISELKASFASDFASVISLLGDIKTSIAAGNHNVGGEFEDPMHAEASSEDFFDGHSSGGYQNVDIGEELGADLEHSVQIASKNFTTDKVRFYFSFICLSNWFISPLFFCL